MNGVRMFEKREEIKELLDKGLSGEKFNNELANISTIENAKLSRTITVTESEVDEWLAKKEGDVVGKLGNHWTNMDSKHSRSEEFKPSISHDAEIVFYLKDGKGYELQYFNEWIMDEDVAYEIQDNDEVYNDLMNELGSDADMYSEAEVIVDNNTEYIIEYIEDARDEMGYIIIELRAKQEG